MNRADFSAAITSEQRPAASAMLAIAKYGSQARSSRLDEMKCKIVGIHGRKVIACAYCEPVTCSSLRIGRVFRRGFAAECGSGDEGNHKAHRQRLHEGVGYVHQRVLVELLRSLYSRDLCGAGDRVESGRLCFVNLRGEVGIHEIGA